MCCYRYFVITRTVFNISVIVTWSEPHYLGHQPLVQRQVPTGKKMDVNNVQIQNIIAKNQVKVSAVVHVSLYVLYVYLPVCLSVGLPVSHPVRYIVGV